MRLTTFLATIGTSIALNAQTEVMRSTMSFSDGTYPTMMATFENANASAVESWYKDQLRDASKDVSSKKEVRALGARVPEVMSDTITVLCKAEEKKNDRVEVHLAYRVHGAWVGNDNLDAKYVDGAKKHALALAVRYNRQLLEAALANEQKGQGRSEGELADLIKEKGRVESSLEKTRNEGVEAEKEKTQAESDLKTNDSAVSSKHSAMGSNPTEEEAKQFLDLVKNGTKLKEKIEKETKKMDDAAKKVTELEEQLKDNVAATEVKQKEVDEQGKKVEAARKALEGVK